MICLAQAGVENVRAEDGELRFQADEDAVAALSIALGQARIGVTMLAPETASLEDLFLGMTEGDATQGRRSPDDRGLQVGGR